MRLLLPLACVSLAAMLGACSNGLERYPEAIDYDQLELRKSAILNERSRAPAAYRDEHTELLEQMERHLEQTRREEQLMRMRRIEFLEKANREQLDRTRAWEEGQEATAQQRAVWRAKRYPTREEGLELLRRSEQASLSHREELHTRYTWSQGTLYTEGPERIQRESAALRARYEERRRLGSLEGQRLLEEAQRHVKTKELEEQRDRERNRQLALQQVTPLSIPSQPDVPAANPNAKPGAARPAAGIPFPATTAAPGAAPAVPAALATAAPTLGAPPVAPANAAAQPTAP